jgi:single-stranded-DNA-specific exonuclease
LTASGATPALVDLVAKAGPYGAGNPEPVFAFPAHRLSYVETFGAGHMRARLTARDGTTLRAVAFRCAEEPLGRALSELRGRPVHVAGSLDLDHWQGEARVTLRLRDVAEAGPDGQG